MPTQNFASNQDVSTKNGQIDWNNSPCPECRWTRNSAPSSSSLKDIIHHYGQVANSVNAREFKRFIEDLRSKWNPLPPAKDEWEEGYRGEGWTDEGAFALCAYEEANDPTGIYIPIRLGPLCEAEEKNQVLLRPVESLIDDIVTGPLYNRAPEEEIVEALESLKAGLQLQANESCPSGAITVKLPKDFEDLLRITDGISGAGVPSETAHTYLVGGTKMLLRRNAGPKMSSEQIFWRHDYTPIAAWKLGGCTQHRHIYYVLCRDPKDDAAPISWKIFDRQDAEMEIYHSLADFLSHQSEHVEKRPGGHQQEHILYLDRYPPYRM